MKNKIICTLLAFLSVCSLIGTTACNNEKDDKKQGVIGENVVYSFNEALYDVKMSDGFGKVQVNQDVAYVKTGKKSLKLTPFESANYPIVTFPFFSKYVNSLKNNLRKLHSITFEIYATESADIGVGLYFSKAADTKTPVQKFSLKKGWNTIVYKVDLSILELYGNLDNFYGAYLSYEGGARPVLYVDSISVDEAKSEIAYETLIDIDNSGEGVLLTDFERSIHSNLFNAKNASGLASPVIEVVKASDHGITPNGGEGVLRVEPTAKNANNTSVSNTYLFFAEAYMRAVDWSKFTNNLGGYSFKFDLYTKCSNSDDAFFGLYLDYGTADNGWTPVATKKRGEWTTCSVSLNAFSDYINDYKGLAFKYEDVADTNREFFIDNVRIEKGNVTTTPDANVWNSFDHGECVLESVDTTWYEELDGEHGVIEFSLENLKTRQFRPKNFKSVFGVENYQGYKYLKFRVKANTNFAFAMIYESKWRSVSFNNYKQTVTGEWVDYYVDLSELLPYFDGFNSNLIIRIDADKEDAKICISDIRAVNEK